MAELLGNITKYDFIILAIRLRKEFLLLGFKKILVKLGLLIWVHPILSIISIFDCFLCLSLLLWVYFSTFR